MRLRLKDLSINHDPFEPCAQLTCEFDLLMDFFDSGTVSITDIAGYINNKLNGHTAYDEYCKADVSSTNKMMKIPFIPIPQIKDVIFNPPATIVLWSDGTKTVVKAQDDDIFDPEKGLSMAISKKAMGNKGNYFNNIKKWTDKYEEECLYPCSPQISMEEAVANVDRFHKYLKERFNLKKDGEV